MCTTLTAICNYLFNAALLGISKIKDYYLAFVSFMSQAYIITTLSLYTYVSYPYTYVEYGNEAVPRLSGP